MNVSDLLSFFPNGVDIGPMEGRVSSALGGDSSVFKRWYGIVRLVLEILRRDYFVKKILGKRYIQKN